MQNSFLISSGAMRFLSRQFAFTIFAACALLSWSSVGANVAAQAVKPAPKSPTQTRKQPTPAPKREPELRLEPIAEDPSVAAADVAITARVRARELTFDVVPNPSVEFPGQPARDTVWEAERENLPTPVQPGVTYRNIGIRLKITSVFSDIDRIVAEALGEIPVTDDIKPTATAATNKPSVNPNAISSSPPATPSRPRGERH